MAVPNTDFQTTYTTNGTAGPWNFSWRITDTAQVQVYLDTVLQSTGTYTITQNLTTNGGYVTFNAGSIPAASKALLLQRVSDTLQSNSFQQNAQLPPATLEAMFDKLTIIVQQLAAGIQKSLSIPLSAVGVSAALPLPVAGGIPVWNTAATATQYITPVAAGLALIDNGPGQVPSFGPVSSAAGGNMIAPGGGVPVGNLIKSNNTAGTVTADAGIAASALTGAAKISSSVVAALNKILIGNGTNFVELPAPTLSGQVVGYNGSAVGWVSGANSFTTSAQAISNAGGATIAHGLGAVPSHATVKLQCKTADAGWSVGDRIEFNSAGANAVDSSPLSVGYDGTNVYYRFYNAASPLAINHKTTGATTTLTPANWDMYITVYA